MKRSLLASALLAIGLLSAPATASASGVSQGIPAAHQQAFYCDSDTVPSDAKKTVLLVHGVGTNGEGTYSWNYQKSLRDAGYDVCLIDLPSSGRAGLTESAKYVSSGIKLAHERLGKPVSVIGHSGGPTATLWALRYDADAAAKVDDFISLAGALHGTTFVGTVCQVLGSCPAIGWQMHIGSDFMTALHAKPLPENVSVTSVYSRTDYGIQPAHRVSHMDGASNIAVQDVCTTKLPGHLGLLSDPAAHAVVMDALGNEGSADPARLTNVDCSRLVAPGVNPAQSLTLAGSLLEYVKLLFEPRVNAEPALPAYAVADLEANKASYETGRIGSSEGLAGSSLSFGSALANAAASSSR